METEILKQNLSLNEIVLLVMGIFSTMPIVCLNLFGRYISFFSIFLILSYITLFKGLINFGKIRTLSSVRNYSIFILWLFLAIISCFCGWIHFSNQYMWREASLSNLNKIIIFILFSVLWINQKDIKKNSSFLLKGIVYGCVANMLWATVDGIGFYLFGISLNNILFHEYAVANDIRNGALSIIRDGLIRASGFNYDPAHLGFIVPSMLAYSIRKNKKWLWLLVFFALICSASTTALVCSIIVLLLNIKYIKIGTDKTKIKKNLPVICLVGISLFLFFLIGFNTFVGEAIRKFWGRIYNTYINFSQDDYRVIYVTEFFNAISTAGIMIIFGTGFGTASYAYVFNNDILFKLGKINYFPYDMEMTYIAYFFDLGIVGFIIYIFLLYKIYHYSSKSKDSNGKIIYSLLIGMILSAFFYHYTLMAMQVLVVLVGMSCSEFYYKKRTKIIQKVEGLLRGVN